MTSSVSLPPAGQVPRWVAALLLALMFAAAAVGHGFRPEAAQQKTVSDDRFVLERDVPLQFGDWRVVNNAPTVVTNPEIQQAIDRLYSQVLTRSYRNAAGYTIMLSIAYGEDQRGGLQAHRPEVCYPAQGFELLSNEVAEITTPLGVVDGRRLVTRNARRHEPVTYWFNIGGKPVTGRLQRRLEEVRLVMTGQSPDGLLFRVSSIDPESERALREQEQFIGQLLTALQPDVRKKIAGL
jgi:EpsI family protein